MIVLVGRAITETGVNVKTKPRELKPTVVAGQ